jgi:hypothetical protein
MHTYINFQERVHFKTEMQVMRRDNDSLRERLERAETLTEGVRADLEAKGRMLEDALAREAQTITDLQV